MRTTGVIDLIIKNMLSKLASKAVSGNLDANVLDNSIVGYLLAKSNVSNYSRTTDSLEALAEAISNISGGGGGAAGASTPLAYSGTITAVADATHFTISTLADYGNDYFCNYWAYVVWHSDDDGSLPHGEYKRITDYASSTGVFTHAAFSDSLAVDDKIVLIHKLLLPLEMYKTTYGTETVGATDVNGTTWKDLLDKSTITAYTEIWGIKVTKGGTWAGDQKIRITDGAGNKLFPFGDEAVEGTDFIDTIMWMFPAPVKVPISSGYKVQFRSSDAADGAGETLALTELDKVEIA